MESEETTGNKEKLSLDALLEYFGFGLYTIKMVSIMGVLYVIDGIQLTSMTILMPLLRCRWTSFNSEVASIHTCGLLGMALGGVYWGWLADKWGRKGITVACTTMVLYFGVLTVFCDNFVWFMTLRLLLGFGVGGMVIAPCYIAEVTTSKYRGKTLIASQIFFGVGSVYTAAMALLTLNNYGWKRFVVLSALPIPFLMLTFINLPESIHYLRNAGNYDKLLQILLSLSITNKKPFALADVEIDCRNSEKRGKIARLFKRKYLLKLIIMCVLSFAVYFCYYGAILQHTYFLQLHKLDGFDLTVMDAPAVPYSKILDPEESCHILSNKDYEHYVYACVGELLAIILTFPFIDFCGRKRLVVVLFIINVICCFSIMYISATKATTFTVPMSVFLAILRGSSVALIAINCLLVTEIFPTVVRGTAVGLCAFCSRISIVVVTLMVHELYPISIVAVLMIFVGLCVLCCLLTTLLPETTGQLLENK